MNSSDSLERTLGRLESRVSDLSEQITAMRQDVNHLTHTIESTAAEHHQRLIALESFRRWAVGVMTGMFMSGVAAVFGWLVKK